MKQMNIPYDFNKINDQIKAEIVQNETKLMELLDFFKSMLAELTDKGDGK
jgi:hypothetical protein